MQLLLARGANPNANDTRTKHTALMLAIAEGHADIVRTLVDAGADVHAKSAGGFTPLLFAARHGSRASSEILLAAGAKVDDRRRTAARRLRSPLAAAAKRRRCSCSNAAPILATMPGLHAAACGRLEERAAGRAGAAGARRQRGRAADPSTKYGVRSNRRRGD